MVKGDLERVSKDGRVNPMVRDQFLLELGEGLGRVREDELGDWEEAVLERLTPRMD